MFIRRKNEDMAVLGCIIGTVLAVVVFAVVFYGTIAWACVQLIGILRTAVGG